ncbi:unnamed protein product [Discula destructiva]
MALTYKESQLVKSTIPFLREHGETVSSLVYSTLIKRHPELNNTLNVVHLKDGRLAQALTVVILRFASNINNVYELIPKLERISNKHCTLGVKPEHYPLLGSILIEAFQELMGPALTPETKAAWTKAYTILSHMLIGREKIIYKEFDIYGWPSWRKFRIEHKVCEADDLWSLHLVPIDGRRLPKYLPGQYVSVRLWVPEVNYHQTRQYSMSDSCRGGDEYRITLKRAKADTCFHDPGMVSSMLIDKYSEGDELEVSHPSGDFYMDPSVMSSVPVVLISAGGGVSPLFAMLNGVLETKQSSRVSWIHGCRSDVPFATKLTTLKRRCPNLHTVIFKTQVEHGDIPGVTYDFNSRMNLHKVQPSLLHTGNSSVEYYVCGPEDFMKTMMQQLVDMGVDPKRIRTQLFHVGEMKLETVCGYMSPASTPTVSPSFDGSRRPGPRQVASFTR